MQWLFKAVTIIQENNYYAFGMEMDLRTHSQVGKTQTNTIPYRVFVMELSKRELLYYNKAAAYLIDNQRLCCL